MEDPEHYYRLLRDQWRDGEDIVVLEHDILAWGINALEHCPHAWCLRPYHYGDRYLSRSLGLTKFSSRLTKMSSSLLDDDLFDEDGRRWSGLDGRLNQALTRIGFTPHIHRDTWHAK